MKKGLFIAMLSCLTALIAGAQNTVHVKNTTACTIQVRFIAYNADNVPVAVSNDINQLAQTDTVYTTTTEGLWPKELPKGAQIKAGGASSPCNLGAYVGDAYSVFPVNSSFGCEECDAVDYIGWAYPGVGYAVLYISPNPQAPDLAFKNNNK